MLLFLYCLTGCIKDIGNYDYKGAEEVEPLKITGLEKKYQVDILTEFSISPIFPEGINEQNYDYIWYAYKDGSKANDTLGLKKNLNTTVILTAGDYKLTYRVINKQTGISVITTSDLTVKSVFSQGMGVVKDENGFTDVDWIQLDGTILPSVISKVNGKGLPGKAGSMSYLGTGYENEEIHDDGTISFVRKNVFFVMSDSDLGTYYLDNMKLLHKFETMFVETPLIKAPQEIYTSYVFAATLFNAGKVHQLSLVTSPSAGKFGYNKISNHKLSKYKFRNWMMGQFLLFDEASRSFVYTEMSKGSVLPLRYDAENDAVKVDPNNMDYDLVFMKERAQSPTRGAEGFGIMKHKDKDEYYAFMISRPGFMDPAWTAGTNPFSKFKKIEAGKQVGTGKVFANNLISSVVYFSTGNNVLNYFNMVNHEEKLNIFTCAADEKITFINHIYYKSYEDTENDQSSLAVLTNSPRGWKLYMLPFIGETADVQTTNYKTYSGTGHAAHVMFKPIEWEMAH